MNNFMFSNNSWPEEMQLKSSHRHSLEKIDKTSGMRGGIKQKGTMVNPLSDFFLWNPYRVNLCETFVA